MTLDSENQRTLLLDALDGFVLSESEFHFILAAVRSAAIVPPWEPEHRSNNGTAAQGSAE